MPHFSVSREDWSLHRQGQQDQERHREKVREAIRDNLADIVSDEAIITSDGKRIIKVPIRSLNEYRFRYDVNKQNRAGQGNGKSRVGDVIARDNQDGQGKGPGAGEEAGVDYYEAEVTVDELAAMIFEDLGLPWLDPKRKLEITSQSVRFNDIRKKGLWSNIDKKRTILETLRRNALHGHASVTGITPEDLRFKTWEEELKPQCNAVILAMMDTSGSMGEFEKYLARGFFFWTVRFLRTKYDQVEIIFLAHHTSASEVSEPEFFTKGESGGTKCSSVYQLALEIIAQRYPPDEYNLYAFHFSDGDNALSDNEKSLRLIEKLLKVCNLVGYGEVCGGYERYHTSTLHTLFKRIDHSRFVSTIIKDKSEVFAALRAFFGPEAGGGEAS